MFRNRVSSKIDFYLLALILGLLPGCHQPITKSSQSNACQFLYDNPRINQAVLFYAPTPSRQALTLAVIKHESNFKAKARPVKSWLIQDWIPWRYYSSARGYAQITDPTWSDFSKAQNGSVSRYALIDHIHFVNWYFDRHEKQLRDGDDFYEYYFLFHDGPTGYHQKKYRRSRPLHLFALRVAADAKRYREQLSDCQGLLHWMSRWQQF